MLSSVPKNRPQPTWKQGFARSAAESAHPNLWDGLVGAWSIGLGPTGLTLFDVSGRRNNGTLTNMDADSDWVIDDGRYSLVGDGVDDFVLIPHSDILNLSFPFSISIWLKYTSTANLVVLEKNGNSGYSLQIKSNKVLLNVGNTNGNTTTTTNWNDGLWHLVVFSIPGTAGTSVFVDGKDDTDLANDDAVNPSYGSSTPMYLLSRGGLFTFDGSIDEPLICNRAINANEAAQLYESGRGGIFQRKPLVIAFAQEAVATPFALMLNKRKKTYQSLLARSSKP